MLFVRVLASQHPHRQHLSPQGSASLRVFDLSPEIGPGVELGFPREGKKHLHQMESESLRDSNPKVLTAWAFRNASFSGAREACADLLTTTEVLVFCGAWGPDCRTRVLAATW